MIPGRPKKPAALLDAVGAFDKNPNRRREDAVIAEGEAEKPTWVKGRAARIWNEYAPRVAKMGLLKAVDAHSFGVWCNLAAEFEESPRMMPAARITAMRQAGEPFGLSPMSRAKAGNFNGIEKEKQDPAEKYFDSMPVGPGNAIRQ